jgi:hypothetical protein
MSTILEYAHIDNTKSALQLSKVFFFFYSKNVIWPWCWVGKKKMEVAMDSLKDKIEFRVRWEPFLLKPDIPADGIPKPAAYTDPSNPRWDNTFW